MRGRFLANMGFKLSVLTSELISKRNIVPVILKPGSTDQTWSFNLMPLEYSSPIQKRAIQRHRLRHSAVQRSLRDILEYFHQSSNSEDQLAGKMSQHQHFGEGNEFNNSSNNAAPTLMVCSCHEFQVITRL